MKILSCLMTMMIWRTMLWKRTVAGWLSKKVMKPLSGATHTSLFMMMSKNNFNSFSNFHFF